MNEKTILDILDEKGVELKREGTVIRGFCPFHNDTGRPNFTVYPQTNSWFCFACNMGGDVAYFLSKFEHISYKEAQSKLSGVLVDLESLQESLDGLSVPDDEITLNYELNVLVSKMIRAYLQKYPEKIDEISEVLRGFDLKLLHPVHSTTMGELLQDIKIKLGIGDL